MTPTEKDATKACRQFHQLIKGRSALKPKSGEAMKLLVFGYISYTQFVENKHANNFARTFEAEILSGK